MILPQKLQEHIRRYIDFIEVIPICEGYSQDQKFLLITQKKEKFLVRITESDDIRDLTQRMKQFEYIHMLSRLSALVPKPYHILLSDYARSCIMILEYIEGENGEKKLPDLSQKIQYEIGYQAGEELKKVHGFSAPTTIPPWQDQKTTKYSRYWNEFLRNPHPIAGIDLEKVQMYIEDHRDLLLDVHQTFLHDDFHPANLIIQQNHLTGIIDFNRCDFGDPIHDFYKVAHFSRNISIPFSRGQIDGYFKGMIPLEFWLKYTLYVAMSIVPDMVWSQRCAQRKGFADQIIKSDERIKTIYKDHNGFQSIIPLWYTG